MFMCGCVACACVVCWCVSVYTWCVYMCVTMCGFVCVLLIHNACVCDSERAESSNPFCSALVPLVKGPSVQLTQPGLSLFTVTVTRAMEAQTKGGLFLLSCPRVAAPLWVLTEARAQGLEG